jgi:outer membrane murein-binding lipoprotein Lpp
MTVWMPAAAAIAALLIVSGCSQKKTASETRSGAQPQQTTSEGVSRGTPTTSDEPREATVTEAATVPEIWAQIVTEQNRLSAAIQEGRLQSVPGLAHGIRDLAAALANKASASNPPPSPKLAAQVEQLKTAADDLAEQSNAGDLKAAQTEFAKLSAILDAIKANLGPQL